MKRLSILVLSSLIYLPATLQAADGLGSFYSNVGATLLTNDDKDKTAYSVEVGYRHKLDQIFSADVSYKRVETFDSNVSQTADDFVQSYDSYGFGVRADQNLGTLSVYAGAGASYIVSEVTTWNTTLSAEQVDKDQSFKPYARAGISIASPIDSRLTIDAAVNYQMLADGEYATSLSGGVNYAF